MSCSRLHINPDIDNVLNRIKQSNFLRTKFVSEAFTFPSFHSVVSILMGKGWISWYLSACKKQTRNRQHVSIFFVFKAGERLFYSETSPKLASRDYWQPVNAQLDRRCIDWHSLHLSSYFICTSFGEHLSLSLILSLSLSLSLVIGLT